MARIILILGGVRSGKSRFAQQLAQRLGGSDVLFVATAEAGDDEMRDRINVHRRSRPAAWKTVERATGLAGVLAAEQDSHRVVLLDCVTLLVSNLLLSCVEPPRMDVVQHAVEAELESLLSACKHRGGPVILVSGEVGLGLVPESALGRMFRDLLGWANQAIAAAADETYLMVAGLPIELRQLATSVEQAAAACLPCESD